MSIPIIKKNYTHQYKKCSTALQENTRANRKSRSEARYLEDPGASLGAVLEEGRLHLDALLLQVLRPPHGLQPLRGLDHLARRLVHRPHAVQSHNGRAVELTATWRLGGSWRVDLHLLPHDEHVGVQVQPRHVRHPQEAHVAVPIAPDGEVLDGAALVGGPLVVAVAVGDDHLRYFVQGGQRVVAWTVELDASWVGFLRGLPHHIRQLIITRGVEERDVCVVVAAVVVFLVGLGVCVEVVVVVVVLAAPPVGPNIKVH